MEVLRLNPTTYMPDAIIEGYNSMIWTERYQDPGDFELKTPLVTQTWNLLPELSFISLRDSKEVMFVEDHSIGRDSEGWPELTITGRTLDAYFENREVLGDYQKKHKMAQIYSLAEAALVVIWNSFINDTGQDVMHADARGLSVYGVLPGVVVSDSTTLVSFIRRRWTHKDSASEPIFRFIRRGRLGVRMIRPNSLNANIVTVSSTLGNKGIITRNLVANTSLLRFDLFNGVDRSREQSINEPVIFHFDSGHIDDPKYLFSIKNEKNRIRVTSSVGDQLFYRDGIINTGFDRRHLIHDVGTPGTDESVTEFQADFDSFAEEALDEHDRVNLIDGEISLQAPYKYGTHYSLGDKVTLLAEYDIEQTMMVGEYVRTEDIAGDRGYPGLVVSNATVSVASGPSSSSLL